MISMVIGIVYLSASISGAKKIFGKNCYSFVPMIDATIVRAHACAAGYGQQCEEGLGRSKGGFSSKIHAKNSFK